jgi:hypothetical protein
MHSNILNIKINEARNGGGGGRRIFFFATLMCICNCCRPDWESFSLAP